MNDFTKVELEYIFYCVDIVTHKNDEHDIYDGLEEKIQSMIYNYGKHDAKWIAQSHLKEAYSLMGHAMGLLGMDDE